MSSYFVIRAWDPQGWEAAVMVMADLEVARPINPISRIPQPSLYSHLPQVSKWERSLSRVYTAFVNIPTSSVSSVIDCFITQALWLSSRWSRLGSELISAPIPKQHSQNSMAYLIYHFHFLLFLCPPPLQEWLLPSPWSLLSSSSQCKLNSILSTCPYITWVAWLLVAWSRRRSGRDFSHWSGFLLPIYQDPHWEIKF